VNEIDAADRANFAVAEEARAGNALEGVVHHSGIMMWQIE
jgi:hypothetical protein